MRGLDYSAGHIEEEEIGMAYGHCGKKRDAYRVLVANLIERGQLEDNGTDESY
jgi:hypothetical protein